MVTIIIHSSYRRGGNVSLVDGTIVVATVLNIGIVFVTSWVGTILVFTGRVFFVVVEYTGIESTILEKLIFP